MPNGKGALDCSYCIHSGGPGYPEQFDETFVCKFHGVPVPPAKDHNNRICCHFAPNDAYQRDQGGSLGTVQMRFAWFGIEMRPGVLYEFHYNYPPGIKESTILRVPNYHSNTWKLPDEKA